MRLTSPLDTKIGPSTHTPTLSHHLRVALVYYSYFPHTNFIFPLPPPQCTHKVMHMHTHMHIVGIEVPHKLT